MSLGNAAGLEMPFCLAGTPVSPGRALRLFLSSNSGEMSSKPLMGDLCSQPGSVPPGEAAQSSEQPVLSCWGGTEGAVTPSWAQDSADRAVVLSCLHAHAWLRDPSFPVPVFVCILLGCPHPPCVSPVIVGKGWATMCRQPILSDRGGNTPEKPLLSKAPSPKPARRVRRVLCLRPPFLFV